MTTSAQFDAMAAEKTALPTSYYVCKVCGWARRMHYTHVAISHLLWNKEQKHYCPGVPAIALEPK